MATYYVDYENVHNGGIKGIEEADSNSLVYIMYSYIITNDRGFDAAIAMGKRIGYENVARFNTIYGAVNGKWGELVVLAS